jgi:caa(3)-type oxidase subunit IV
MNAHGQSHTPVKTYLAVYGGLAVLTALTVALSYAGLSHRSAIFAAALISTTKCVLISAFFMHLKTETKEIFAVLLAAFFLVAVLLLAVLPDIGLVK